MRSVKRPATRSIALALGCLVSVVSLVAAVQATSRAEARIPAAPVAPAEAAQAYGPAWIPEVVTAPGLPVQCADGVWTRTVVRAGCAKHGGIGP
jgi:hypothetical protein